MSSVSINNVRKRMSTLNQTNRSKSPINIAAAHNEALKRGSLSVMENVLYHWTELNANSNIALTEALSVFNEYCESANESDINKMTNFLCEEMNKVKEPGKAKEYLDRRVKATTKDLTDLKDKAKENFDKNSAPIKANIKNGLSSLSRKEKIKEAYERFYEICELNRTCDRIINNHNKLSKRYNIDKVVTELAQKGSSSYDIVNELCRLIDTYGISKQAKFSIAIENGLYSLDKCNVPYDRKEIVNASTDYFLMNRSEEESGIEFLKEAKQVLQQNMFYSDLMEDKDAHHIKKKDIDIQFDYFFNSDSTNFSPSNFTERELAEWELLDESSEITEHFLTDNTEGEEQFLGITYEMSDIENECIASAKEAEQDYDLFFNSDNTNFSSSLFTSKFKEAEAELMSESFSDFDYAFDSFFNSDDTNFSSSLFDSDYEEAETSLLSEQRERPEVHESVEIDMLSETYVNVVDDKNMAMTRVQTILPPEEVDDDMYDYHLNKMQLKKQLMPVQDKDTGLIQAALALKKKFISRGIECNLLKYTYLRDVDKYVYLMSIINPKKNDKFDYSYAIVAKDTKNPSRIYLYYIYNSKTIGMIGKVDHFTFKLREVKENYKLIDNENSYYLETINFCNGTDENSCVKYVNDFKASDNRSIEAVQYMIEKMFTRPVDQILIGTPGLLALIRTYYAFTDNAYVVEHAHNLLMDFVDKFINSTTSKNDLQTMIDIFRKELEYIDIKCRVSNEIQCGYRDVIDTCITALSNAYSCYTDEEAQTSNEATALDYLAYVSVIENDVHYLKNTDLDVILDDMTKYMPNLSFDNIDDITKYSIDNPEIIEPAKLKEAYENLYSDLKNNNSHNYMLIDCLKENIYRINHAKNEEKELSIEESIAEFHHSIEGLKAIKELLDLYKYTSSNVMQELSITNSLKLASEKLKKAAVNLSDKERSMSKSIDVAMNNFKKGVENSIKKDSKEAVIKGSVLPSASKVIKMALVSAGVAVFVNPALAVIGVLGYIGMSKKYSAKERQNVLDEIEIELKMTEKYLKIAEDRNDLKATKDLLKIQRALERQRQRIKYKMKVHNQDVPEVNPSDYEGDD